MNAARFLKITIRSILLFTLTACQPQIVEVSVTAKVPVTVVTKQTQIVTVPVTAPPPSFVTPHPILGDRRVRQGIAYCTNRAELLKAVYPWLDDTSMFEMDSIVPSSHWAYAQTITRYPFDPEKGKVLFEEVGWMLAEGATYRTNETGEEMALKLTTTDAAFRKIWVPVFEKQMMACGLRIVPFHTRASWLFGDTTGLIRRDFEMAAFAWVYSIDPGGRSLYACDAIPSPDNAWHGQNYTGWCNEAADAAIHKAAISLNRDEQREAYRLLQEALSQELPTLPLFMRLNVNAADPALEYFAPDPFEVYTWNAAQWRIPGKDTIVIGEASEPASLFALENAYVSQVIGALVHGLDYTRLNYDYQPGMLKQFPTIENGQATLETVEVGEGASIVDSDGDVAELKAGVRVRDAEGREHEYDGGPVQLSQLTATYEFVEGLRWSDGVPVSKADYELAYRITCAPHTGAPEFLSILPACEKIDHVEFVNDTTYVVTWKPGYLDPAYILPPVGRQPAHRVISDGRKLADVPASQWTSLDEVMHQPLGVGPYILSKWEYGKEMTFTANPYYYAGRPATPTLVVRFLEPGQMMLMINSGDADVVGWDSVGPDQAEALLQAQQAGRVRVYFTPSTAYEHLEFALFVK